MLKKHNKLIMLLVLVTFMFTMVGSAGAATFSDVSGTSVEAAAVYRLNGLGIIDGYPDGTFGPEKTITRAEFAKIACVTAGLKSVASGMGGTASPFSDVATDHWANGWINVAAAQGYVKGDPAGTFRPEDQITQAEVVTVLMRLLGYNDNLAGEWPSDYIAKAANLGVLDDVTFVAGQSATRGIVAVIASATLDENVVEYAASDNIFNEAKKNNATYTLLEDNFESTSTEDAVLVYDLDLSDGEKAIEILDPLYFDDDTTNDPASGIASDIDTGNFVSYTLTDDCVISGATSITGVAGRFVEYTLNDDDEVVYIEVKNDDDYKVITGIDPADIERVDGNTIKLDSGKSYDIADNFDTYSSSYPGVIYTTSGYSAGNFKSLNAALPATFDRPADSGFLGSDLTAVSFLGGALATGGKYSAANGAYLDKYMQGVFLASESIDLVLDDDGDIAFVSCNAWPTAPNPTLDTVQDVGIVDRVSTNTGKVSLKNGGSFTLDADDADNQVIIKNGKVVGLSDLAENDMVWFLNKYNTDVVVAMSITAAGMFESYEETTFLGKGWAKKVIVGDKEYKVIKGGGFISTDDGDNYFAITDDWDNVVATPDTISTDLEDATGGDVTVYLSPSMTVAAILAGSGDGSASSIYGVINDDTVSSLVNGKVTASIEVILPDGTYATYAPDEDSEIDLNGVGARDMVAADITGANLDEDDFVQITLNSDGYIDVIKTGAAIKNYSAFGLAGAAGNIAGDKDEMTIIINGNSYDVANAVIYNTSLVNVANGGTDDDEVDTVSLAEFIDNADSTIVGSTGIYGSVSDGEIKYLVFNNAGVLGTNNKLAMVTGKGTDSDGAYVKIMTTGDPVKYSVKSAAVAYAKGTVVNYSLSSGDVKINNMAAAGLNWAEYGDVATLYIDSISGNIIAINGVNYSVDADTLYFDFTEDDPVIAEKGDFSADDHVLIYQEAAGDALSAIVLID